MTDAGMLMPVLVLRMPMPNYGFTVSPPRQSDIGIPASVSDWNRWSRINPVVPSYVYYTNLEGLLIG
jgi:hypothetical protein